jgi:hypothetical protein
VLGKIVLAGSTDADFAHFEEGIADHQKAADEEAVVRIHQEDMENAKKVKSKSRSGTVSHSKGLSVPHFQGYSSQLVAATVPSAIPSNTIVSITPITPVASPSLRRRASSALSLDVDPSSGMKPGHSVPNLFGGLSRENSSVRSVTSFVCSTYISKHC